MYPKIKYKNINIKNIESIFFICKYKCTLVMVEI
jgi:hypothetical protein